MLFRSEKVTAQWDTWCYFHEDTFYLYYLITEHSQGEGFGVATSSDGVHWNDHGWAIRASDKMVHFLGTGAVWADPVHPGRFLCNYSEHRQDGTNRRQCILFASSTDLIHWEKCSEETIFWIDESHYERYGRWDSIFPLQQADGSFYGTWTATPKGRTDLNGGIGIGTSKDGIHWSAVAAPQVLPDADEAGAIFEINGRIHGMFGHLGGTDKFGMYAYSADTPTSTYRLAQKNACLLKAWHSYYSRSFETPDGLLANHHVMNGEKNERPRPRTFLAPFKKIVIDKEGIQRWVWWSGNDILKQTKLPANQPNDFQQGVIIEGQITLDQSCHDSALTLQVDTLQYRLNFNRSGAFSVQAIRDPSAPPVELQAAQRDFELQGRVQFRILARRGMLEVYLDNYFMECCNLDCPDATTIRLLTADGHTSPTSECWSMSHSSHTSQ